jgi:hypothetical protein
MSQKHQILRYTGAYLLWIVSTGVGILVLNLVRETGLLAIVVRSSLSPSSNAEKFYASLRAAAVTTWSILMVGVLILLLLVGIENFYRMSVPSGKVLKRFFLVTGIELAVLFVSHSIYYALLRTFRPVSWTGIAFPAVELVAAVFFFWLYKRKSKRVQAVAAENVRA